MPDSASLYDILGLDPTATPEQIRKAYRLKALETHPDKLDPKSSEKLKQASEKKFHQVCEAFEVLNDPGRRKAYDSQVSQPHTTSAPAHPDEVERLTKDRAEWARQQQARYQSNNQTHKARIANEQKSPFLHPSQARPLPIIPRISEEEANARIVESMMQGLRQLDPEWERRRLSVLKRRAERLTSNPRSNTVRS
ncbi:hypothetical protein E1B28_007611 [Marasmius oreades]|uniref:J domain-containing protein n=1 Tax=Marasmius oreades TaxID=181124 RepID=A0A9P7S3E5_9AGAR|nr:uncharacterized protein E1B28_007611 [Marasmius oreades]KAG7093981.1 hypothetical protein E1B28_007611 [Marasmius oreades]